MIQALMHPPGLRTEHANLALKQTVGMTSESQQKTGILRSDVTDRCLAFR